MANELAVPLWRKVPTDASAYFTDEQRVRAQAFARRESRVAVARGAVAAGILLVFVVGRGAKAVANATPGEWWIKAAAVVTASVIVDFLARLPVERARWALDVDSAKTDDPLGRRLRQYSTDALANLPANVALAVTLFWVVRSTPMWWLWAAGVAFAAALLLALVRPLTGGGKREQFTSLDDERVRRRLVLLAREAGVEVSDALVLRDVTNDPNALVAGLGNGRVLVLYDGALKLDPPAIDFMLAHELAHVRLHHVRHRIAFAAAGLILCFGLLAIALRSRLIVEDLAGLESIREPAGAILVVAGLSFTFGLREYVGNALSRFHERVADVAALTFTRDPAAGEAFLQHLGDLGRPIETSGIRYLRSSHPPLAERIELLARWRRTRQAAILFTDVVDSTATVDRVGDRAWVEMLHDHEALVRECVDALHGKVVKDTGDGFLAELPDIGAAVLCAIRIQRSIAERAEAEPDATVHARIGVHAGEVVRDRDDMRGREVHFAARVAGCADADQIFVSEPVASELEGVERFVLGPQVDVALKGLGAHPLREVLWHEEPVILEPA